jgi:hypothetical protein
MLSGRALKFGSKMNPSIENANTKIINQKKIWCILDTVAAPDFTLTLESFELKIFSIQHFGKCRDTRLKVSIWRENLES